MATSLDLRTFVLMDNSNNANITLELVDVQFKHSWSVTEFESFLGKESIVLNDSNCQYDASMLLSSHLLCALQYICVL